MKTLQQIKLIIAICIATIFQVSCDNENNPCPDEYLGDFSLLENARDSIPYLRDTNITFIDENGNQAVFEFRMDSLGYLRVDFEMENICESNPEGRYIVRASGDHYRYYLKEKTSQLGFDIIISLTTSFYSSPDRYSWDYLIYDDLLVKFAGESNFHSAIRILVNQREFPEESLYLFDTAQPQIILLERTFYQVYTNTTHPEYKNVWYNTEYGVIGFEDHTGKLWVLDSNNTL